MSQEEKKFVIDEKLVVSIGNYLLNRPMIETEGMVNQLRTLQLVQVHSTEDSALNALKDKELKNNNIQKK